MHCRQNSLVQLKYEGPCPPQLQSGDVKALQTKCRVGQLERKTAGLGRTFHGSLDMKKHAGRKWRHARGMSQGKESKEYTGVWEDRAEREKTENLTLKQNVGTVLRVVEVGKGGGGGGAKKSSVNLW